MHFGAWPSAPWRDLTECREVTEPLWGVSWLADELYRRTRVCVEDTIAIARCGWSRMYSSLDFSGAGDCPAHELAWYSIGRLGASSVESVIRTFRVVFKPCFKLALDQLPGVVRSRGCARLLVVEVSSKLTLGRNQG